MEKNFWRILIPPGTKVKIMVKYMNSIQFNESSN